MVLQPLNPTQNRKSIRCQESLSNQETKKRTLSYGAGGQITVVPIEPVSCVSMVNVVFHSQSNENVSIKQGRTH